MKNKVFFRKAGEKSLEYAARFGNQKHLTVLRDAFALLTPLIIAGALAVLVRTFIFGAAGGTQTSILGWIASATGDINIDKTTGAWAFKEGSDFLTASNIGNFLFFAIGRATIDVMSLYVVFGIGYFLSSVRKAKDPIIAGLVALASFLIATLAKTDLFSAQGLLTAIVIGILSTELFCLLEKSEKLNLKMPAGVPPAVARAFAKLFPIIITSLIIMTLNLPFILIGTLEKINPPFKIWGGGLEFTIGDAIFLGIQAPFMTLIGNSTVSLGIAILYTFVVGLIWFFGIHGTNVLMGIFSPIYLALYYENVNGAEHIFVQGTFDAFIFIGGTGATLAWIVAVFIFGKNKADRELAKLGVGPGIFQINEPIIFGLPVVLNVKYVIPFILVMPILTITTYLGFTIGNIHPVTILIPWTTPVAIGGLLATALDWQGFVLALINFIIAFAIWTPFVMVFSRKDNNANTKVDFEDRIAKEKEMMKKKSAGKEKVTLSRKAK